MQGNNPPRDFRLGRLRFIRLPPTQISLNSDKTQAESSPFELGIGITDDYGTDIDLFESINLRLEVVSGTDPLPVDTLGLKLASDERSKSSTLHNWLDFTFTPARGPFHGISIKLSTASSKATWPSRIRFRLSVAPASDNGDSETPPESGASRRVRKVVREEGQRVLNTWNDYRYIFLSVESGDVNLTKQQAVKASQEKVQTTFRRVQVPEPSGSSSSITIVERPGLNNSTGQRLWDCAIGLSTFFSLYPDALDPKCPISVANPKEAGDSPPSNKRRKTSARNEPYRILELGAGCALASMVARRTGRGASGVVATDIEATVDTTLQENLEYNSSQVEKRVLEWGRLTDDQVDSSSGDGKGTTTRTNLTLIATDVLYNPESHQVFLDTLLSFLRPASLSATISASSNRALVAYKSRTEGDDGFFGLARKAGLAVDKVWEWSEVSVWSIT